MKIDDNSFLTNDEIDDVENREPYCPWWLSGTPLYGPHLKLMQRGRKPIPWDKSSAQDLSPQDRARVAKSWKARIMSEYLAISTLSILSIDMTAAGAPADLLSQCHRAALDEIRHTELCLRMYEIYSGQRIHPEPAMSNLPDDPNVPKLHQAVSNAVLVACVAETYATTILASVREHTSDPTTSAVFTAIYGDEIGHARLGWAFLRWALDKDSVGVKAAVEKSIPEAVKGVCNVVEMPRPLEEVSDQLRAHGIMHPKEERVIFSEYVRDVLTPGFTALGINPGNLVEQYGEEWAKKPPTPLKPGEEQWQAVG